VKLGSDDRQVQKDTVPAGERRAPPLRRI